MISAALAHDVPAQPVWSFAFLFVWALIVPDQALKYEMALFAYLASLLTYHANAFPYAASASCLSSEQPLSGSDRGPQSTVARGFGVRDCERRLFPSIEVYALDHGCEPALTLVRIKLSWDELRRTPGCLKDAGARAVMFDAGVGYANAPLNAAAAIGSNQKSCIIGIDEKMI